MIVLFLTLRRVGRQVTTLLTHLDDLDGTDMRRLGEHQLSTKPVGSAGPLARRLVQEELIRESNDGFSDCNSVTAVLLPGATLASRFCCLNHALA